MESGSVEQVGWSDAKLTGWSKAQPQATAKGDVVADVEVTQDVQVGMAFGKTSGHGTESIRMGKMPVPLYVRRSKKQSPNNDNRIRFDDAHPP